MRTFLILLFTINYSLAIVAQEWTFYDLSAFGTIGIDRSGNKWFGSCSNGNLVKFDDTNWTYYDTIKGLTDNCVSAIAFDNFDNMWLGTSKGAMVYNGANWITYDTTDGLANNSVRDIVVDNNNYIWFGTYGGGLSRFDGTNWETYVYPDGPKPYIFTVAVDGFNNKWIAASGGAAIFNDTIWTNYNNKNTSGMISDLLRTLTIDVFGNIWVGTFEHGISKFDGLKWTNYRCNGPNFKMIECSTDNLGTVRYETNMIECSAADSLGNVWFGTHYGVLKFDGTDWIGYTEEDGLSGNLVYNIAIDKKGNKWFITNNGISKMEETPISDITSISDSYIQLYPSLVKDRLFISFSELLSMDAVIIYSIYGVPMYISQNNNDNIEVDMSNFPSGIYFVKVSIVGKTDFIRKIIKQ